MAGGKVCIGRGEGDGVGYCGGNGNSHGSGRGQVVVTVALAEILAGCNGGSGRSHSASATTSAAGRSMAAGFVAAAVAAETAATVTRESAVDAGTIAAAGDRHQRQGPCRSRAWRRGSSYHETATAVATKVVARMAGSGGLARGHKRRSDHGRGRFCCHRGRGRGRGGGWSPRP